MKDTLDIKVRRGEVSDGETLCCLINALADNQGLPRPDAEARLRLKFQAFDPSSSFNTWLAEVDGKPVGYAVTFYTYSTFLALPSLHLEDIFVLPEYRLLGVGKALFAHCAKIALERNCGRIEWLVLHSNAPAREFYKNLGANELNEWLLCRLTREEMRALAATQPHKQDTNAA